MQRAKVDGMLCLVSQVLSYKLELGFRLMYLRIYLALYGKKHV